MDSPKLHQEELGNERGIGEKGESGKGETGKWGIRKLSLYPIPLFPFYPLIFSGQASSNTEHRTSHPGAA